MAKNTLLVSVIIPTLNEQKYVEHTLKSIKNQDYEGKFEIIIADGGSRDKTLQIARKYADRVITAGKRGIGAGRNAGASAAKGEILIFVDADTIPIYNTFSEVVKAFKNRKIVGVAVPIIPITSKMRDFALYLGFNQFMKNSIKLDRPNIVGSFCAYRRQNFEKIGGFDESLHTLEDFEFSERISKLGKIVLAENTLVLTSTRRIAAWGRQSAIRKYIRLYLKHLLRKGGLDLLTSGKDYYGPIR
jgi:glycosyltransferase involved in cell wall biosynthesis